MLRRSVFARSLLVLAIAGLFATAATAATARAPTATPANGRAGSKSVSVSGSAWNPTQVAVTRGGRVTWRNPTSVNHNVVAYGGKWSFRRSSRRAVR
jgi:plastocyanin